MDIDEVLEKCGYKTKGTSAVLKNIANLDELYSFAEITEVYNYLLMNEKNPEFLRGIVKLTDSHRSLSTLNILLDILVNNKNCDESDEEIDLRVACAQSISRYKDTSTLDYLLNCLNNKKLNYKIRLACADALGRIGDRYAVVPLINVVKDEDEKSVYLKESATFALGLIGDTSAIDPLVDIMDAKQGIWDKFSFLKEKIIEALGRLSINNAKVLRVFKNSLSDSSAMVRINTVEALMNSEYEEAPELIRKALHDEDEEVQRNAIIALYNIVGRDILDEVISLPGYSNFLKQQAQDLIDEYEDA